MCGSDNEPGINKLRPNGPANLLNNESKNPPD